MNTLRNKLKHGFGNTKKSAQRPTVGQPTVSASGSRPDKSVADESRSTINRRSKKTTIQTDRISRAHSETTSTKNTESRVAESVSMDRRKTKNKSILKNKKKTKPSTTPSFVHEEPIKEDRASVLSSSKYARTCDSAHDGRMILQTSFGIHIDQLFKMLFTQSDFYKEFQDRRNTTELQVGEWKATKDGQKNRIVTMTLALQASIGPKTAKIIEAQSIRKCSHCGELYSIDVISSHEGIPYADVFNIFIHYCLSGIPNNNTEMIVYANVNFLKPTWAVIKTFIMKHSLEGLSIYFCELQEQILKEIAKSKRNSNYKA